MLAPACHPASVAALVFFHGKAYQTSVSTPLAPPYLLMSENLSHIYWDYWILIREGAGDARRGQRPG
jgi:hypothetical protein